MKGIARYTGENLIQVNDELLSMCKRLHAADALIKEYVLDILMGLSICTNSCFCNKFQHLKASANLNNIQILPLISANASVLGRIEAILQKASDIHDQLFMAWQWIKTAHGGPALAAVMANVVVEKVMTLPSSPSLIML